ncbi:ABC transporter ATP-binding protein [Coleofasciculus sp. E2-BRE-01]|uniref:ABC transporter ATP-binding protein n=1 Tax=Coleofasciculus sp. E2-BRE-01 TaxID=3069524 RepID=UPI0032F62821
MSDTVIQVENLGKKYMIGHQQQERYTALRDVMANGAKFLGQRLLKPWGKQSANPAYEEFWALKDISFEVKQGDRIGIIGRNGAGKSTLLKILSRITEPTTGRIRIKGRVASLLEVGTGFHPELTGRENIYLNGAILGMSKAEIKRKFDEIVDFAGIEKFLDTPVKRYSSGMYVRLAFAVAAHLEPEILIVDEVLAVGDVQFQKKCLGKMEDVGKEGRTVLLVSHNIGMIRSLCQKGILLSKGNLIREGIIEAIITDYLSRSSVDDQETNGEIIWSINCNAPGSKEIKLRSIRLLGETGKPQSTFDVENPITVEIIYEVFQVLRGMRIVLQLINQEGVIAFASTDHCQRDEDISSGCYKTICKIPGGLLNKEKYKIKIHVGIPNIKVLIPGQEFISFLATGAGNHGSYLAEKWPGVLAPKLEWRSCFLDKIVN